MMEDSRSALEKVLAGDAELKNFDLFNDFDISEIRILLDEHILEVRNLSEILASDMIINGMLSYEEYPFEDFSPYEQIRQLEQGAISLEEFKAKIILDDYDEEDKKLLQELCPEFDKEEIMSNGKFIPNDELEEAVFEKQNGKIIRLIAEGVKLHRPDILATDEFFSLPIRIAAVVYECAMSGCLRRDARLFMKTYYPESEVNDLLADVEKTPDVPPSAEEEKLMQAILNSDDRKVCRLIGEERISLRNMTEKRMSLLCRALMSLKSYTVVLLLAEGIHYASVPALLKFLLRAYERENGLNGMDYKGRVKYTNLLIHILQGEITAEDDDLIAQDWYPMGNSIKDGCDHRVYCHSYSYYFDPQHLYEPRYADGEYEKPEHSIR